MVALYLTVYPVGRFLIEYLRGDERLQWVGLTMAQQTSIALFIVGLVFWFKVPKRLDRPDPAKSES